MSRNPNINLKPVQSPCETGQFANGEVEGEYYRESWNLNGWVPQGGPASASPGGDPGSYRNARVAGDFEGKSYGVELSIDQDAGQYEGQVSRTDRITVDVSMSPKNPKES